MTTDRFILKDLSVLNAHPLLVEIVEAVNKEWGLQVVTSAYRPKDLGVHGTTPLRGLDLRCRDDELGTKVATWVNERYGYDHDRPNMVCAVYHDVGFGKHLHLQAHSNTYKIDPLAGTSGRYPV